MSGAGVQSGRRKKEWPDHGVAKVFHQTRSRWGLWSRVISSSSRGFVELRSIRRWKKVRPAGTILAAKPSVPIRDSNFRLVQEGCYSQEVKASLSSLSLTLTRGRQASK